MTANDHIGRRFISSSDQYLRMLLAPNVSTSSPKCCHKTAPKLSIKRLTSSRRRSSSPERHLWRYSSSFSRPACIFLCCVSNSNSFLNSGIFFARTGKMCCSSIEWWKSSWEQNCSPVMIICRADIFPDRLWEVSHASISSFQVIRKWLCW